MTIVQTTLDEYGNSLRASWIFSKETFDRLWSTTISSIQDSKNSLKGRGINWDEPTLVYHLRTNKTVHNEVYVGMTYVRNLEKRMRRHRIGVGHCCWPNLEIFKLDGPMPRIDAEYVEQETIRQYIAKGIPLANKRRD